MIKRYRQEFLLEVTEGEGKGFLLSLLRLGLTVLSGIYGFLLKLRSCLYRCRLLKKKKLPGYTISVGNITVGGTGKTPAVAMLVEKLQQRKHKVVILSRGYKRVPRSRAPGEMGVVSRGKNILMEVREAGDEPYLLAKNLPGIAVLVGKDRISSGNYALTNFAVDTLVLDDGYQYWPLTRDLDIVVIDSANPFGNGYLLPRGRLREPLESLERGDLFLLTRADQAGDLKGLREKLKKIKPGAKIVETVHNPDCLIDLKTGDSRELTGLSGKKVLALSSIGRPESFEKTLAGLGALLVGKRRFPDHHWYREAELREVGEEALRKGAEYIVTTEKDAVRIPPGTKLPRALLYLTIKLKIVQGEKVLERSCCREFLESINYRENKMTTDIP
ncbi:MAG: tetraacyldisaccharide 4'-kinase [Nitrospirae bacterium]|nr:tetraacyldisaccharide 4'-kinase [Nitrospirota bacterium]